MNTFNQYIKESAADFEPALRNFQAQVLDSPSYYTSLNNLKSSSVLSANDAKQLLINTGSGDPEEHSPKGTFDDSKYVFVQFSAGPGRFGVLVSVNKNNGDVVYGSDYFYGHDINIFKGFRWEQIKNEKRFQNVAMYVSGGMGNVIRVDCKELIIQIGKYAQYEKAIMTKYLQKNKSKWRGNWITGHNPFCIVVPITKAINPDDLYSDENISNNPNVVVKKGRYASFDPRWESDFIAQLKAKQIPIVWSHENIK